MLNRILIALAFTICHISYLEAQELPSFSKEHSNLIIRFNDCVKRKTEKLEAQLTRQTEKYLQRLARKEEKLRRKLQKTDSTAAKQLFEGSAEQYAKLSEQLKNPVSLTGRARGQYLPYVDSLKTSLSFLQQNSNLLHSEEAQQVTSSLQQVQQLQGKLQQTEQVKAFIKQRKEQIKAALSRYTNLPGCITKTYQDFNKELFYYSQQVQEYKDLLNDPDKLLTKALSLLNKLPAFQSFMQQHSELAGLFAVPAGYSNGQSLAGLQTRNEVQQLIQTQLASAGPNANELMQQNLQAAQAQLNQLKDKINKLGDGGADLDMPNFKPDNQKTKSFWQRLEYGTNLQTQKSNNFFPTTSDIGLSVGYKLSDKSIIGIGGSYKVGWGKDIRNIAITSEGAGLRSFLDVKLKGSFFASGGFEYNYHSLSYTQTLTAEEQKQAEIWQQSGLVGISKIVSLKSKVFRKTKLQLLWDFLNYRQLPRTQAIKFRVGYHFK
ncbi:hypothetical protein HB364_26085 [Pseudoflavitalea sp. X16]|uniref:hypothetical protein n=1 Tax=Paraflavitalea devenefica TaxID=2716334 RepID=UPI00142486D9|nr:hypothetical protein [Paraflavitalea devenefica]NII28580.1 hypothetical protein [Paraflavitalea devenefica]